MVLTMKLISILSTVLVVVSQASIAQQYDVVILNGRIMDPETQRGVVA